MLYSCQGGQRIAKPEGSPARRMRMNVAVSSNLSSGRHLVQHQPSLRARPHLLKEPATSTRYITASTTRVPVTSALRKLREGLPRVRLLGLICVLRRSCHALSAQRVSMMLRHCTSMSCRHLSATLLWCSLIICGRGRPHGLQTSSCLLHGDFQLCGTQLCCCCTRLLCR